MEDAYAKETTEVLAFFNCDATTGLTDSQVATSRTIYGPNTLPKEEGTPFWKLILKQFDDLLVKILIVAAIVSFGLALVNGDSGWKAFLEPGVILMILVANAAVGVITETNAEKAIEELKAYQAEVATVLRQGRLSIIPAADLVPGDLVEVAVGWKVPADCRLLQLISSQLRVDQAILTGESSSVGKVSDRVESLKAVYQDKTNILFSGTMVTAGRARAVVVGTGIRTAIGKIQDAMSQATEESSPLKKKLDEFGTFLSKVIAVICILVWVVNIQHFRDPAHGGWFRGAIYYFKIAVALAVAAIPEGLPAVVTTCLALGTQRMAALNAIVRSLPSVETLGCTTVICSDKTGTLTTATMSVARVAFVGGSESSGRMLRELAVGGTTYAPEGAISEVKSGVLLDRPADSPCLLHLAMCSALCNDSSVHFNAETGVYEKVGESTEVALRVLAEKVGLPGFDSMPSALTRLSRAERASFCNHYWEQQFVKLASLEFSRDRKMMSVLCARKGHEVLFVKGAPEVVISRCSHVLCDDGGTTAPLSQAMAEELQQAVNRFAQTEVLRCLALALRPMPSGQQSVSAADEAGLTLLGVVGMLDPPRDEVRSAVQTCRAAGVRVIVVTGDNKATAEAVCRRIGLLEPLESGAALARRSMTAAEFEEIPLLARGEVLDSLTVLSRVEPSHKSMLVEALKRRGEVVAMTGDGVNDAPALKLADIGVAMGSGTAVAKGASDMVLADDNFRTIVAAVAEGRAIYNNTKQFIRYMVSSNIGEVVCIFVAAALGMPETLSPVQLLWVNLVTDGLPATALGFNRQDHDVMTTRPRKVDEAIVNGWLFFRYLVIGFYVGLATVGGFTWWYLSFSEGPRLTWKQLVSFDSCLDGAAAALGNQPGKVACTVFNDRRPSTVSMTVLVVVEMFNALNNLSENQSLLRTVPWSNLWLLAAIAVSMALHFSILYIPPLAAMFSVTALSWAEWKAVLWLSFPVILVDEVLKFVSRRTSKGGGLYLFSPGWSSRVWRRRKDFLPKTNARQR